MKNETRDRNAGYGVPRQKFSTVKFFYKDGISNVSGRESRKKPGKMTLYKSYEGNKGIYTEEDLEIVAAHEFGHILGINDGYNNSDTKKIDSIMCDQFGTENNIRYSDRKATNIDLEMALQAYKSDQWQYWYVWTTPKS